MVNGLSLERLKTFLEVAEAGGFSKAADYDPSKQSQFSRQVGELEEYFKVKLKRQKGRGIELTDEGKQLAGIARQCFSDFNDFYNQHNNKQLTFVIAAHLVEINWILTPRLSSLMSKLGRLNLAFELHDLTTKNIIDQINDNSAHFAILREDAVPTTLDSISLGEYGYSLFAPIEKIGNTKRPNWKSIMNMIPLATMVSEGQFSQALEKAAKENEINLDVRLRCSSFETAAAALRSGEYAVILPDIHESNLEAGMAKKISAPFLKNQRRKLALAWKPKLFDVKARSKEVFTALKSVLKLKNS